MRIYRVGSKRFLAASEVVNQKLLGFGFWVGNKRVAVCKWGSLVEINLFGWTTYWSLR
jgi:hypothetical protein